MKALWNTISNIGISSDLQESDKRSIILLNRISFVLGIFLFTSVLINLILGTYTFVAVLGIAFLNLLIGFRFTALHKSDPAKVLLLLTVISLITYMSFAGGKGSGLELYFLSLLVLPVLLFRRGRTAIFFQILSVSALIAQRLWAEEAPPTGNATLVLSVFYVVNAIYSASLISLGIMFYRNINKEFDRKLRANNRALTAANSQLDKHKTLLSEGQRMAHLGSWEWTIGTDKLTWSDEMYRIMGYEPGSVTVTAELVYNHIYKDDLEDYKKQVQDVIRNNSSLSCEIRIIRKDGSEAAVYFKGRMDHTLEGPKLYGSALDMTVLRNSREQLKQKDEFISIATHELRTPLTSIKAYNQLLQRALNEKDIETASRYLQKNSAQIANLNALIDELLEVSRLNNGQMEFSFSGFVFNDLVEDCVRSLQSENLTQTIIIEPAEQISIIADQRRIEQVIMNYLTNAIKYSPGSEKIIVRFEAIDSELIFSVQDFGIGIPAHAVEFIFNRFFRVQKTSARFSGLGIGLYISNEIIKKHKGHCWVETEEGKGSTFFFKIPLALHQSQDLD